MFKIIVYSMNQDSGYFEKDQAQPERFPVPGMPTRFQRQQTWDPKINRNAGECLQLGPDKIFTGLQPTSFPGWFVGDLRTFNRGNPQKHLLVIKCSLDNTMILIALYRNFYKPTLAMRLDFANRELGLIWRYYKQWTDRALIKTPGL